MPTLSPTSYSGNLDQPKRLADYEPLARICSAFLLDLFAPAEDPNSDTPHGYDCLPYFIAVAFSQAQLPDAHALAALTLLQRLKSRHPTRTLPLPETKGKPGERLFLSSYIVATKVLSDDRYRLQFWAKVGQNKFSIEELGQMEKEFFEDLDWDVRIDDASLAIFQLLVERRKQLWEELGALGDDGWKTRKDSTESNSSSSTSSSESTGFSSSTSNSSCSSGLLGTPPDRSPSWSVSPIVQQSLVSIKESEETIADLDQRIHELEHQFSALSHESSSRGRTCSEKPQQNGGTRFRIKQKLLHSFK